MNELSDVMDLDRISNTTDLCSLLNTPHEFARLLRKKAIKKGILKA